MQNTTFISANCHDKIKMAILCNEMERAVLLKLEKILLSGDTEKIRDFESYVTELYEFRDQKILTEHQFKALAIKIAGDVVNQSLFLMKV